MAAAKHAIVGPYKFLIKSCYSIEEDEENLLTSLANLLMIILSLILSLLLSTAAQQPPTPPPSTLAPATVNVGVILDLDTSVGLGSLAALSVALSDFYSSRPNSSTRLLLLHRHSPRTDTVGAAAAALDLISNHGSVVILGPQTSTSASFVADLGARARVPVVTFTATSPYVSPALHPFFIRAVPSDADIAPAIAALATAFSWHRLVPIYEDSDYGASLLPNIVDALSAAGDAKLPYRCPISPNASDDRISEELYQLKTLQTRVFVLHASSALASRILSAATAAGMTGQDYAWILTSAVASQLGSIDPSVVHNSLQGAVGVRPYIHARSERVRSFEHRWRAEMMKQSTDFTTDIAASELSPYFYYAYDALFAVAAAVEAAGIRSAPASKSDDQKAELANLGISEIGPTLLKLTRETEFDGIAGRFRLVDGELNVSAFQIVNVNGERGRGVGFWTPSRGLSKNRKADTAAGGYSAERGNLGTVIWAGDSVAPPKGWEMPTGGEKLKIAVPGPPEPGFRSFLSMDLDPETQKVIAGGFVIEIFEAARRRLPYALPLEYVPWVNKDGKGAGDYNTLVKTVLEEKFDGVVGDVTITANRSENADFTLPYTASGISMVVPVHDVRSHRTWLFLKPLSVDLWLVSGIFFIFTGFVVWLLEHRINDEFRGPPSHQFGTVFYFAFSTLVFSHKEKIMSNLSRMVIIIWVFVVLILTSSYTASLTSMLTVRRLEPTVADFQQLILERKPVGFLHHSFVKGLLLKMGFDGSQLFPFKSPQEYRDALNNGTVDAIIDEIPYLRVFLKLYCENFTMGPQIYKTSGFGFVFPKGSSLVPDLSRAILNLTESEEMVDIERRWFGDVASCPDQGSSSISPSSSLDFNSFFGLFLITGVASFLAFVAYFLSFCYRNRRSLAAIGTFPEMTFGEKLNSIARLYDAKDLSSHTFKKSGIGGKDGRRSPAAGALTPPRYGGAAGCESPFSISLGALTPPSLEFMSPSAEIPQSKPALAAVNGEAEVQMVAPRI
ncbi:Glutamate receptor 2.7 [Apostasia shenzhenica]|uniref:Glutamate receptor 2.7 n=1 Tax=Apostasia shenzhenica TaxID=1088818 RepID=A0A2I0A1L5_9ASPA|nr:Glutamate receptor 2.7 [Apostasia shenzhenica]